MFLNKDVVNNPNGTSTFNGSTTGNGPQRQLAEGPVHV